MALNLRKDGCFLRGLYQAVYSNQGLHYLYSKALIYGSQKPGQILSQLAVGKILDGGCE